MRLCPSGLPDAFHSTKGDGATAESGFFGKKPRFRPDLQRISSA
jgi:hypothetical protein